MKRFNVLLLLMLFGVSIVNASCSKKEKKETAEKKVASHEALFYTSKIPIDSVAIDRFFIKYPKLQKYQKEVFLIYNEHRFNQVWYDQKGLVEFSNTLYNKSKELDKEGLVNKFPYQEIIEGIFDNDKDNKLNQTDTELMVTNLYVFLADNLYKGLNEKTTASLGWMLPRKKVSYTELLNSFLSDSKANRTDLKLFFQYYELRDYLEKYRELEKKGGWKTIEPETGKKVYVKGDTSAVIKSIKERLRLTGDFKDSDSSEVYTQQFLECVKKYQIRNGLNPDGVIGKRMFEAMNVPLKKRIQTLIVNMERCRWVSPDLVNAKELIAVNIPSFRLTFFRQGKVVFRSPVVVGETMNKTVIFSGNMSHVVFSPYWNVPTSIINSDIKPGMARNKNYLAEHNMEWNNGQVRQKPGKRNSLGLVKFIFPNSNNIYLHDTPSKSLFDKESRAFSHGCIRVAKPKQLAMEVLKGDPNWDSDKIDAAMNAGKEKAYYLKEKIPVYIGYFTAWVDEDGILNFYDDVYSRDERLAKLIFSEN